MTDRAQDAPTPWEVRADTRVEVDSQKRESEYIAGFDIYAADGTEVVGNEGILGDAEERAKRIVHAVNLHEEMVDTLRGFERFLVRQREVIGPSPGSNLALSKVRSVLSKELPPPPASQGEGGEG